MSALGRVMLALAYGLPVDRADADELGRIFDATPLHGTEPRGYITEDDAAIEAGFMRDES